MENKADPQLERLLEYLRTQRGFDFTGYKRANLTRRVDKRVQNVGVNDFAEYQDYLEVHPEEFTYLFNTILINVTSFFRDRPAWDYLAREILPALAAQRPKNASLRVWSAGGSTGEEAYTLAMLLAETLGVEAFRERVKIYATDVDEEALDQARHASYSPKDMEPVPPELRDKYFELAANRWTFRNDLRRSVIFGRHDLVHDAPISRLDLLVCRNSLMYFNAETQSRILARFHFALKQQGLMFLGKAETLLTRSGYFVPVELKYRIFARVPDNNANNHLLAGQAQKRRPEAGNHEGQVARLRASSFDTTPVAQVVVDADNTLALSNKQANHLFGLTSQDIGRPFHELPLSFRPVELRGPLEQAYMARRPVTLTMAEHTMPDGGICYLEVKLVPLANNDGNLIGVSILFEDMTRYKELQSKLLHSKEELETAYEELQSSNEELETTNEELQSTVEELETTNEELQSSNEELETTNEELQSTNEELKTMNEELRQRTDDVYNTNTFLQSILTSVRLGVVVLNSELKILVWNRAVYELWGLRSEDVSQQSFLELNIGLPVEQLREPLEACLSDGSKAQERTLPALNRRGQTIQCHVVCAPLVVIDQSPEGVLVLMEQVA
jgi:two-component system CheB/CheR fusion protein